MDGSWAKNISIVAENAQKLPNWPSRGEIPK